MEKLFTPYGPTPGETPLTEHPNPYFERKAYLSLNGPWDFSLDQSLERPAHYGESILVPFAVETPLSGVGRKVNRGDVLHYRKEICFPEEYVGKAGRIVFTAVDQVADVYLNGSWAAHHEGGYLPFEIAIPAPSAPSPNATAAAIQTHAVVYWPAEGSAITVSAA